MHKDPVANIFCTLHSRDPEVKATRALRYHLLSPSPLPSNIGQDEGTKKVASLKPAPFSGMGSNTVQNGTQGKDLLPTPQPAEGKKKISRSKKRAAVSIPIVESTQSTKEGPAAAPSKSKVARKALSPKPQSSQGKKRAGVTVAASKRRKTSTTLLHPVEGTESPQKGSAVTRSMSGIEAKAKEIIGDIQHRFQNEFLVKSKTTWKSKLSIPPGDFELLWDSVLEGLVKGDRQDEELDNYDWSFLVVGRNYNPEKGLRHP